MQTYKLLYFRALEGLEFFLKLKFLHTSKAHYRILRQIVCQNTKFKINLIKNKDDLFKTTQYKTPGPINFERIRILADSHDDGHGYDDDDDDNSCYTRDL